jgi:hypothetical protein
MEFEWDPAKEAANLAISARRARTNEEEEYRKHVARRAPETEQGEEARPDDER